MDNDHYLFCSSSLCMSEHYTILLHVSLGSFDFFVQISSVQFCGQNVFISDENEWTDS